MQYDFSNQIDRDKARQYLEALISHEAKAELKKQVARRSRSQNAYFHCLVTLFCIETGYTMDESKAVIKRALGLYYRKNGQVFLKSTAALDKSEMTDFIERFRNWAARECGITLHSPEYYEQHWQEIDAYIKRNRSQIY